MTPAELKRHRGAADQAQAELEHGERIAYWHLMDLLDQGSPALSRAPTPVRGFPWGSGFSQHLSPSTANALRHRASAAEPTSACTREARRGEDGERPRHGVEVLGDGEAANLLAHLLRKSVSFSERDGPAGALGRELLDYIKMMFGYWYALKAGNLSRDEFRELMAPVRKQVEAALERAVAAKLPHVAGSCADILAHRAALWTFVDQDGVEPTNNHAQRELRAFVLWRKRSFGIQSERGNLFAERLMTVAHTARKQKKNVLAFLTACCSAARDGTTPPSLFATA